MNHKLDKIVKDYNDMSTNTKIMVEKPQTKKEEGLEKCEDASSHAKKCLVPPCSLNHLES